MLTIETDIYLGSTTMKFSDSKYLIAYVTPFMGWWSLTQPGLWSFSAVVFMFGIVPVLDAILPMDLSNPSAEDEEKRNASFIFDILLYLNLPILYFLFITYFIMISGGGLTTVELIGKTMSIGFIGGAIGINVAHEIGHRTEWYHQLMAKLLLLPNLYMHFTIEHNRGHHKWVATPKDPATSRKGESFYAFWIRTVLGSIRSAWKIESTDVVKRGHKKYSLHNEMIQIGLIQIAYLVTVGFVFGPFCALMAIVLAILGFTLLESVNYIEHYGLMRKQLPSGRYEPVQQHHSWNSDHHLGRILLYELTRHSDHHYKSTRKYQVLRRFAESPQMPHGYPAGMLLATIPPLWFRMMHKHPALQESA